MNSAPGQDAFDLPDLDYELPEDLVAQRPAPRRQDARLLVVGPGDALADSSITELPRFLRDGDLLILNDTRVLPAKFYLRRPTGGRIEGLFLHEMSPGWWQVLLKNAGRCHVGEGLELARASGSAWTVWLRERCEDGHWVVEVDPPIAAIEVLEQAGWMPLPPYIHRKAPAPVPSERHALREAPSGLTAPVDHLTGSTPDVEAQDRERYQTIYARVPGAVAAPTAGLHFTPEILRDLESRGIRQAFVTLHVGEATFKPITAARLRDHEMHPESFDLPAPTAEAIRACRRRGGRVVAVGTTSVRVLETNAAEGGEVRSGRGSTSLFIYPPYRFRVVDLLLTNFHLPGSTLLALVMALGGVERVRRAYRHAVDRRYRFYSYGDAMLVFRR